MIIFLFITFLISIVGIISAKDPIKLAISVQLASFSVISIFPLLNKGLESLAILFLGSECCSFSILLAVLFLLERKGIRKW